ncbi:hypothetical protein [Enterobacter ludwigii]
MQLPFGTIVMYSGKTIPDGWVICDGKNGTPDLTGRMIISGNADLLGGKSNSVFSGGKDNLLVNIETNSVELNVNGTSEGHALHSSENGAHSHIQGEAYEYPEFGNGNGYVTVGRNVYVSAGGTGKTSPTYRPKTQPDGDGIPHSHKINLKLSPHNHIANLVIPYYVLMFIQYVG